ncbi:OprD family outer membrane porin [Pseudomonas sp. PNP]|uniref:OprD family outer membrane porin n=1 Tax=Pseudomonas sp. PNP TaxID=361819 RepID=UPI001AECB6CD|nr:OprD family outer membrane porin [Pseudomonas sp. PNP]MBP2839299.1 OprD family porin [Pseudomonas sp. PNP]
MALGPVLPLSANADFITDSKLNLGFRTLYYNNDNRDNKTGPSKTQELAKGLKLDFQSGYTDGPVGFGLDALGLMGITLDSGKGRHVGSTMIPSDGDRAADEWSRLGLTFKMKASKTEVLVGTLAPKLPILVFNDGRLLQQAFQGAMVTSREFDGLTLVAGKLDKVTGRGSSDRTGLAVGGGREQSDNFSFAGVDYKLGSNLLLQYYHASLKDYYRQDFLGAVHVLPIGDTQKLKTDLRYFRSRAQGANASGQGGYQVAGYTENGDGKIDNDTWSATFTYTVNGHSFLGGYQKVSDNSAFVQPNQASLGGGVEAGGSSTYLYTDRLTSNFTRAGQATRYAQYAYDFAAMGIPGLNASVMYLDSDSIKTATGSDQREWERDLSLGYVMQSGPLKGLGFLWLNAKMHSEAVPNQDQNRLLVTYTLSLF